MFCFVLFIFFSFVLFRFVLFLFVCLLFVCLLGCLFLWLFVCFVCGGVCMCVGMYVGCGYRWGCVDVWVCGGVDVCVCVFILTFCLLSTSRGRLMLLFHFMCISLNTAKYIYFYLYTTLCLSNFTPCLN